ncbi:MAG: biopolymer transporter ExbD [Calditrichaeota bacterium]|nr:biopolymer transporter ExbD [Calditrichota bacterium]
MKLLPEKKKRAIINITPLVDVLFILIIFFAVTSTFLEQPGVKLDLPKAKSTELQRIEKAVLTVTADEQLIFQGKSIDLSTLPEVLQQAMSESQDRSLIIAADENVHHGLVVKIMDIAKQSGVEKLIISTEPEP